MWTQGITYMLLNHCGPVIPYLVVDVGQLCSDNGLWIAKGQTITWNNADLLLIGTLGTNF